MGWVCFVPWTPEPRSHKQYGLDRVVNSVKRAISEGLHPKMITKGSSGSYFAKARIDGKVETVGSVVLRRVMCLTLNLS
jgi:hypothetical protein